MTERRMPHALVRYLLATAATLLLVWGVGVAPASADDDDDALNDFTFTSLDADYTLTRADDGTSRLRVVETFTAEFPDADQNHGMRRAIPTTYNGQPLHPELVSVTDGDGAPRPVETDTDDGAFTMTSADEDFVHGTQVYVFTYDLENVTWRFPNTDADEFYWDVNGVDWPQDFGRITATVHVAPELAGALTGDSACYIGTQGEQDRTCDIDLDRNPDDAVAVASASGVAPHETVTVAVGFERDTFVLYDTGYFASPWGWWQAGSFLVLLIGLAWGIVVRMRALRDAPGRSVIIAEYEPPAGVDALTGAVLLGKTSKAIPAEVLEQAVVGSIRIEEGESSRWRGAKLRAVLVDRSRADGDGAQLLDGIFGADAAPGAEFEFGSTDTRLSSTAQKLLAWAAGHLKDDGYYRAVRPGTRLIPAVLVGIGALATLGFGIAALFAFVSPALPVTLLVLALLLAVVLGIVVAHRPLSVRGAEARDHLEGLREFIAWAEADRIRMLQSPRGAERTPVDTGDPAQVLKIYEPLLPYAVVFGQEKEWAARLADLYGDGVSPAWYAGAAAFNASAFSSGIGSLSASAMASSSTTGGSTGGGSAGGGGGGGGGGGV
ncbi:DUF2207 domain-containing protein [Microbacterium sp. cx-59]|uniref:DUF2207 domain-containing protein n=1 Tax=Microbacterium sp. cx-59 TaxID=2891207 RepID=UPI001E4C379B|nr:DUF2207 domain-containing protein [Microbacterium sp. cx-59]MCC4908177.1 DUF2207 domain-containing protein [Microbacterium sp. cx-59]